MDARPCVNFGPAGQVPPGEGRTFLVGQRAIAVFRTRSGDLFATDAQCPHRGGPLADGLVGGCLVACPLHGFRFDLRTGESQGSATDALTTYPVQLSAAGELLVDVEVA
jgi:nitrite reductase (NADH) small subunit